MTSIAEYELSDMEEPGKAFQKFDKLTLKLYLKKMNPEIKPEDVFENYKKLPKSKRKKKDKK